MLVDKKGLLRAFTAPGIALILVPFTALAGDAPVTALPYGGADFSDTVVNGYKPMSRTFTTDMKIRWRAGCYGTNVRSAGNTLAPDSNVDLTLSMLGGRQLTVRCPAKIAFQNSATSCPVVQHQGFPSGAAPSAAIHGREVVISAPFQQKESIDDEGNYKIEGSTYAAVTGVSFYQHATGTYSGRPYAPKSGPLSYQCSAGGCVHNSPDHKSSLVSVQFPGMGGTQQRARDFCGSYFSPLMLFFDGVRPSFTGSSAFPLIPGSRTHWVEAGAPGYFLALDNRSDRQIASADQLFGDNGGKTNGFEALSAHDLNRDGIINAQDKVWSQLVLWNDRNGDGVSQPGEIRRLKQLGVQSINLKYHEGKAYQWGSRAVAYGSSTFRFVDKKSGKSLSGQVSDIWFSPAEEPASLAKNQ